MVPNGPGAAAGLKSQDAVLAVNDVAINDSRELAQKIGDYAPNTTVDVKVWRGNKEADRQGEARHLPDLARGDRQARGRAAAAAPTSFSSLGLAFEPVSGAKSSGDGVADLRGRAG